jgi:hypothetical protein
MHLARPARRALVTMLGFVLPGLIVCGNTSTALAQSKVAVLGIEASKAPIKLAEQLSATLKEHVKGTAGYKLVPAKGLAEIKLVFGCINESPACMAKVGKTLKAQRLVWGKLVRKGRKRRRQYVLSLMVLDVDGQKVEASESMTFSSTAIKNPEEGIRSLVGRILKPQVGSIVIEGGVKGAEVMLGRRPMGSISGGSFTLRNVAVGSVAIKIKLDGYKEWYRQISVSAGKAVRLTVKLDPIIKVLPPIKKPPKVEPPPKKPSRLGWKVAFWTGVAATVGVGVGVALTGLDVLSIESDKEDYLRGVKDANVAKFGCGYKSHTSNQDHPQLDSLCQDGRDKATITNVLVGVTAGMGVLTGFFAYKAFFSSDGESSTSDAGDSDSARRDPSKTVKLQLQPSITPQGASVGLKVTF